MRKGKAKTSHSIENKKSRLVVVALLRLTDANTLLCLAVCYLKDKLLLSEKCRNFSPNSKL